MNLDDFKRYAREDPEWYIRNVLGQEHVWKGNVDIMWGILNKRRVAVAGCVASSKTFSLAMGIIAFLHVYAPAEVYTTAPTFRQTKKFLWKEIRKIHKRAPVDLGGKLLDTELKYDDDWFAIGISPKDPDAIHGAHAKNILVVLDEAQGIPQDIIDAAENAMAGGNAHMILTFNTNSKRGDEAYECMHSKSHLYHRIRISALDTPNVKAGKTIIPGMIEKRQCEEWAKTFGKNSNFYRVKVLALYPKQASDAVIPIEWIELAMRREARTKGKVSLGIDVGWDGDDADPSVIATLKGRTVMPLIVMQSKDNNEVAGRVKKEQKETGATRAWVDSIGIGAGVHDACKIEGVEGLGKIKVSKSARKKDEFVNLRSEHWWAMREALDPDGDEPMALPYDLELMGELSTATWGPARDGRIAVEAKDLMKKRLKRSPDRADAVILANAAGAAAVSVASGGTNPKSSGRQRQGLRRISGRKTGGRITRRFGLRRPT